MFPGGETWIISVEERKKHDVQFAQINPVGTHITGEQARNFFLQSGLPQMVLGHIWAMADVTADGRMDRKEFSIAMYLIKKKLQGVELPPSLPSSMLAEPMAGTSTLPARLPTRQQNMSLPASPARTQSDAQEWAIPQANRLRYNQLFNKEDRKRQGFLTGFEARQVLMSTGLGQNILAQVWQLADYDGDGKLTAEEFSLAMHLSDMARMGQPLPLALPDNLIPPSFRSRSRAGSSATLLSQTTATKPRDAFSDLMPGGFIITPAAQPTAAAEEPPAQLTLLTLEDKRRENFQKGNAELEKRRAELREQQRKEEEARQAKERAEQEKKEAIRREQDRKKLLEQERLMERQRQMEAEREEQRRKALEAREAARREMERQRQRDWERQRKDQLLLEKKRQEEQVSNLEAAVNNLKYEIETLDNKKSELVSRIAEAKQSVIDYTGHIDGMRETRDDLMKAIQSHDSVKETEEQKYRRLLADCEAVRQTLQNRVACSPLTDAYKSAQHSTATKRLLVEKLRANMDEVETTTESLLVDIDTSNSYLQAMNESVEKLESSNSQKRAEAQTLKSSWEQQKQQKAQAKIMEGRKQQDEARRIESEQLAKEAAERRKAVEQKKRDEEEKRKAEEKQREEAAKKKDEEKWSAFKDLDLSKTSAPPSGGSAWASGSAWENSTSGSTDNAWPSATSQSGSDPFKSNNSASFTANNVGTSWGVSLKSTRKETTFDSTPTSNEKEPLSSNHSAIKSSSTNQTTGRKVEMHEVQYDFDARNADELSMKTGDLVKVYPDDQADAEEGWLGGWKGSVRGWFPATYVELKSTTFEYTAQESPSRSQDSTTQRVKPLPEIPVGHSAPLYDQVPGEEASQPTPALYDTVPVEDTPPSMSNSVSSPFDEVRSSPTPGQGEPAPTGMKCVAIFPWRAKKDNHLTFDKGDEIVVILQQDLWWQGKSIKGQTGWFPKSYVKIIPGSTAPSGGSRSGTPSVAVTSGRSTPAQSTPESRATPEPLDTQPAGLQYLALHAYESVEAGDLVFQAGDVISVSSTDGEWWTGTLRGATGIFPANYVKKVELPVTDASSKRAKFAIPKATSTFNGKLVDGTEKSLPRAAPRKPLPGPAVSVDQAATSNAPTKEIGRVIAAYTATGSEQLSLKPNQLIQIRKRSPSGWWEGELTTKGQKKQIGWFPKDYVQVLPTNQKKTSESMSPVPSIDSPVNPTPPAVSALAEESSRSKTSTPQPRVEKVKAVYPYTAQNDDELSFDQDDVITVLNKNDPDWWSGEKEGGVTGVFPANYVQPYQEPLSEREKKRQLAIHELVDTEEAYVKDMTVALEAFYNPLKERNAIPENELDAIFVNWTELINCNRKLVKAMKVRSTTCGEGEAITMIGDILVENLPNMTPYIRFCSQQLHAAQLLQNRVENDSEAKQIIQECQRDSRVKGMPLSSYILKPMQRITKYPLLVGRVKENTDEDNADYQYISEAYIKAEELVSQVNEGVREQDNSHKLEWIQNHVNCEGLAEGITFNSLTNALGQRKFIYSGVLTKARSGRELYVFLFNDFLLFTTTTSSSSLEKVFQVDAKGIIFKMYKLPVFLNEISVREPVNPEKPDVDNVCFQICHIENIIDIKCASTTEKNAWMKRLQAGCDAALSQEKVRRERAQSFDKIQTHRSIGRLLVIVLEGKDLMASDCNVRGRPPVGRLVLVLREAVDLVGIKATGKSDPYCEVSMGSQCHKTKVIPNTLNPKWNSSLQFPIKSLEDDVLCFTVFDQDRFSPNDFLGRCELRLRDIMKETREKRGPILKNAKLQEVKTGDIVVKIDLQLYKDSGAPALHQRMIVQN